MLHMLIAPALLDSAKILLQFLLDVLYFPLWWYSRGFFKLLIWCGRFISNRQKGTALGVWAKNIFTPMYGQRDWTGKFISFITRVLQILVRSLIMLFWLAYVGIIIALWLAAPIFIVWQIFFQISA